MTTAQYDQEIQSLRNQIASLEAKIKYNDNEISQHDSNIIKDNNCKGRSGSKKKECEGTNEWRRQQIAMYKSSNTTLRNQIASLEKQIDNLLKQREQSALTDSEVSKILASQGKTNESVLLFTEKQADAEREKQLILAQSEAEAISQQTATNKKVTYVVIGVVLLVAVVGAIFLIKKFKKK